MYFSDGEACHYHEGPLDADSWRVPLQAIGWLEHPHGFNRGTKPEGLIAELQALVDAARQEHPHYNFRGLHFCSLCEAEGKSSNALDLSHVNIFIPGARVVYAAPAGIIHYVEVHSYCPPKEFIAAVSRCPAYGSLEFYEALRVANNDTNPPLRTKEEESRAFLAAAMQAIKTRSGN